MKSPIPYSSLVRSYSLSSSVSQLKASPTSPLVYVSNCMKISKSFSKEDLLFWLGSYFVKLWPIISFSFLVSTISYRLSAFSTQTLSSLIHSTAHNSQLTAHNSPLTTHISQLTAEFHCN